MTGVTLFIAKAEDGGTLLSRLLRYAKPNRVLNDFPLYSDFALYDSDKSVSSSSHRLYSRDLADLLCTAIHVQIRDYDGFTKARLLRRSSLFVRVQRERERDDRVSRHVSMSVRGP